MLLREEEVGLVDDDGAAVREAQLDEAALVDAAMARPVEVAQADGDRRQRAGAVPQHGGEPSAHPCGERLGQREPVRSDQ